MTLADARAVPSLGAGILGEKGRATSHSLADSAHRNASVETGGDPGSKADLYLGTLNAILIFFQIQGGGLARHGRGCTWGFNERCQYRLLQPLQRQKHQNAHWLSLGV